MSVPAFSASVTTSPAASTVSVSSPSAPGHLVVARLAIERVVARIATQHVVTRIARAGEVAPGR